MAKAPKDRARDYRQRQLAQARRADKMQAAIETALEVMKDKTGPTAAQVRALLEEGLAG